MAWTSGLDGTGATSSALAPTVAACSCLAFEEELLPKNRCQVFCNGVSVQSLGQMLPAAWYASYLLDCRQQLQLLSAKCSRCLAMHLEGRQLLQGCPAVVCGCDQFRRKMLTGESWADAQCPQSEIPPSAFQSAFPGIHLIDNAARLLFGQSGVAEGQKQPFSGTFHGPNQRAKGFLCMKVYHTHKPHKGASANAKLFLPQRLK